MESSALASASSFTSATTLTGRGLSHLPKSYILPPSERPNCALSTNSSNLPIIDLSSLQHPLLRSRVVQEVRLACKELGFFQVINHEIPPLVMNGALDAANAFFNLPSEEKMQLMSDNVHEPVRYGTSLNHVKDKVHFWRDFLKHYCNPISAWIDLWPSNPPCYKEQIGNYAKAVHELQKKLMELIFESLGLHPTYLKEDIEEGSQVMAVNYYPACPEPELALGLPPHTDYSLLSILVQNQQGLQILDQDKNWHSVPVIEGGLIVQLGDQMEVLSNGQYKPVIHRATVNSETCRISIASLHSLALEKKVGPAPKLVDKQNPLSYKQGSFADFLNFISGNDITAASFIDTLKINK
nr:protein DMR6-LIKE OXYGENASE 2-like [Ipomoea batatas]GMD71645.1 protein DMR6-LIKE OXYGENASE 2-like [Ipomoea batatas]